MVVGGAYKPPAFVVLTKQYNLGVAADRNVHIWIPHYGGRQAEIRIIEGGRSAISEYASYGRCNQKRFQQRAERSGNRDTAKLRTDATNQSGQKRADTPLIGHRPLTRENKLAPKGPVINIAFRFGAPRRNNLRDCDDLRRSDTEQAFRGLTSTRVVSRGQIAEMRTRDPSASESRDFLKEARESAYNQLPICPNQANMRLPRPNPQIWEEIRIRTEFLDLRTDRICRPL